jgi:hypothetical protein
LLRLGFDWYASIVIRRFATLSCCLLIACGGAQGAAKSEQTAPPHAAASGIEGRLQGTWEIVRYESRELIPAEAMPLMGAMFEDLRLSVHDSAWQVEGKDSPFEVVSERGDSFRLKTGGMFDNASCTLTANGEWEVIDDGPTWPGKTVLKHAR